jgi:multicomponent Na+:H+ antiporter subunit E
MMRRVLIVAGLAGVWMALWESLTIPTALAGVLVGTVVVRLVPPTPEGQTPAFHPLAVVRLVGYFAWKLAVATAIVAWEVITPRNRINEGIVEVPVRGVSDGITTLVSQMVSLTPGTLTLEVKRDPVRLYVHVLHLRSVEETRRDVIRLEELAVAAFAGGGRSR